MLTPTKRYIKCTNINRNRIMSTKYSKTEQPCTIPVVRRSFLDEFKHPLDNVQRSWLRRGALIILTLVAIPLGAIAGAIELVSDLYNDCW